MITFELLVQHPHHHAELAQWMFQEWGQFYPGATLEKTARWVHRTSRRSGLPLTMLALDAQNLVGFAMLQRQELYREKGITPWLGGLLVKKNYQRQGVGTRLLDWATHYASSLDYQMLYLLSFDNTLCDWYKAKGWSVVRTDETTTHPLIIMETTLSNKGANHVVCV